MTLEDYDKAIAPCLHDLEAASLYIRHHTRTIAYAIQRLPMRPAFETRAQAELKTTEADLRLALATVVAAREAYEDKPIEIEAA